MTAPALAFVRAEPRHPHRLAERLSAWFAKIGSGRGRATTPEPFAGHCMTDAVERALSARLRATPYQHGTWS